MGSLSAFLRRVVMYEIRCHCRLYGGCVFVVVLTIIYGADAVFYAAGIAGACIIIHVGVIIVGDFYKRSVTMDLVATWKIAIGIATTGKVVR